MTRSFTRSVVAVCLVTVLLTGCSERESEPAAIPPTPTPVPAEDLVARGEQLMMEFRCFSCHTADGRRAAGPTFQGLAGSEVKLTDGRTVIADSEYLRQSIIDPDRQVREGYAPGTMSLQMARITARLQEGDNLDALVAYIESLR